MDVLPHFNLHNYFDTLSDINKVIFNHNRSISSSNLDLHKIRQVMFDQHVSDVIHPSWLVKNDRPNFDICTTEHVSDTNLALANNLKSSLNKKILAFGDYIDEDLDSNNNVKYYINKHGFRCEDFSDTDCIAYIGCSHTFGTGVTQDDIWPELVSKYFNKRTVNLGIGAVGIDYFNIYMNLFFASEVKNCKAIVVMLPPSIRSSFFYHWLDESETFGTGIGQLEWLDDVRTLSTNDIGTSAPMTRHYDRSYKEVLQQTLMNAENCLDRDMTALNTIENVANKLNIPCYVYSSYNFMQERLNINKPLDFARDCSHAGKHTHRKMSEIIINDISETIDK